MQVLVCCSDTIKKNFMTPFFMVRLEPLWGGSLLFTTKFPEIPGIYSFHQTQKDRRLSQPWSHPVVLNTGPLNWESSTLTTSNPWIAKESMDNNVLPQSRCIFADFSLPRNERRHWKENLTGTFRLTFLL